MDLDRETVAEIVASAGAVGLFVAVMVGIGGIYNHGGLSTSGGIALVAAIAGFILLMVLVGVGLAYYLNSGN